MLVPCRSMVAVFFTCSDLHIPNISTVVVYSTHQSPYLPHIRSSTVYSSCMLHTLGSAHFTC